MMVRLVNERTPRCDHPGLRAQLSRTAALVERRRSTVPRPRPTLPCSQPASCPPRSRSAPRRTPGGHADLRRSVGASNVLAGLSEGLAADLQLLPSESTTNSVDPADRRVTEAGEFVHSVRHSGDGGIGWRCETSAGSVRLSPIRPYRGRRLAVIRDLGVEVTLDVTDARTRIASTVLGSRAPRKASDRGSHPGGTDAGAGHADGLRR
jgi:hypothetical protein